MSEATGVCAPLGFSASGVASGVKTDSALDLAVIASDRPACAAGLFTTNLVCGAPVDVSRRHIENGTARAIVVNAGNANACTGDRGEADAVHMCCRTAAALGCDAGEVLVASTVVIGRPLAMDRIAPGIAAAVDALGPDGGDTSARAIMTTDTVPKTAVRTLDVAGTRVTIGGMCKGAGMIAPRLATMLAFITTDAALSATAFRSALTDAVDQTFNRVTIDGDTSTSDMVLALANGAADAPEIEPGTESFAAFAHELTALCGELSRKIAQDGEGATTFVTVRVDGALSDDDALRAARTVAESPLVKTAVFGNDPNWGRIAAALGRSGAQFDPHRLRIRLDDLLVFEDGQPTSFDHADAERIARQPALTIAADLGSGGAHAEMYTCDLSYDYVRINADYTT